MASVLVLFGGRSAEHEVSCVSAVAVVGALEEAGHEVVAVGIDRSGEWWLVDPATARAATPETPLTATGTRVSFLLPEGVLRSDRVIAFDVVFPVLHGPYGEDGTIQGVFEIAGIPYVGCGVKTSALAMDKDLTKHVLTQFGIPTVPWRTISRRHADDPARIVDELVAALGLPLFVKPAELGSSVGVSMCTTGAELATGVIEALRHGDKVIVEEAIQGREIEVAVLDGPRASLPGEIVVSSGWYDYDAKYRDATSQFIAPADLGAEQIAAVQDLACRAFAALDGRGLARIDFFLEPDGRGFLLNEVNTMPGFTPISGFPKMWMASGMSYPGLCNELVEAALQD